MPTSCIPGSSAVRRAARPVAAQFAFMLLFPGFFFYQTLIGLGAMRAFLGGYFSIVSIALFLPLGFSYCMAVRAAGYRAARTDLRFAFFLAYFFLVVAINAVFDADATTVKTHLLSILYFFNIYVIFKTIDFCDPTTMAAALASLLLMSAIIFCFSPGGTFQLGQVGDAKSPESMATYQGFARSYALTFVAVIAHTRRAAARVFLYCIAVAALFLNGSRSELVAVLFSMPLVEIYRAKRRLHMVCLILLAFVLVGLNREYVAQALPESRVRELFDLSQSDSAKGRHQLAQRALQTIAEHPVLGDYASYPPGEYSHNILSAWVDLGIFGFAYITFMLASTAFKLFAGGWFLHSRSGDFLLAWSLICISLLLLATAKTFDDMFAGAALGAYANFRSRVSNDARRANSTP